VHAGGRGKAGGVTLCRSVAEVAAAAGALIGRRLVTKQTGRRPADPAGLRGNWIADRARSSI